MPTRQLNLFDDRPAVIPPRDPSVAEAAKPRLSRQCLAIVERLRRGPATNDELSKIARKYTGRISDMRKCGFVVTCYDHDHETGLAWYRMDSEG